MLSKTCYVCGSLGPLSDHHITPRADGGQDHASNLVTLCNVHHNEAEPYDWPYLVAMREQYRRENNREAVPMRKLDPSLLRPGEHYGADGRIWGVDNSDGRHIIYARQIEQRGIDESELLAA